MIMKTNYTGVSLSANKVHVKYCGLLSMCGWTCVTVEVSVRKRVQSVSKVCMGKDQGGRKDVEMP